MLPVSGDAFGLACEGNRCVISIPFSPVLFGKEAVRPKAE